MPRLFTAVLVLAALAPRAAGADPNRDATTLVRDWLRAMHDQKPDDAMADVTMPFVFDGDEIAKPSDLRKKLAAELRALDGGAANAFHDPQWAVGDASVDVVAPDSPTEGCTLTRERVAAMPAGHIFVRVRITEPTSSTSWAHYCFMFAAAPGAHGPLLDLFVHGATALAN